jgi:fructuronate reductase
MTRRLSAHTPLPMGVLAPGYDPAAHGVGIVHLGLGAFHKAHQAAYTDAALAAGGGDWRIAGVSLRSPAPAAQLGPQDGRYTLIGRGHTGTSARVIGAVAEALHLGTDRARVMALLAAPTTRIVTLTVTEKGYGIDRATGGADPAHPAIAQDLAAPDAPGGIAGLLVNALADRHAAGVPPFTVLSCDNLPDNGAMLHGLLVDFARRTRPDLADHIATSVACPGTMVDRITPAATDATRALAQQLTGLRDDAAIETEAFHQWVIEDRFPLGRPDWAAAGALLVPEVAPYELMKLRMLNGAHSVLAYTGVALGLRHVKDVMGDPLLAALVRHHMYAAAHTLKPLPGVDYRAYAAALADRFANPHLAHETAQIASDGTQKLPQRIFAPTRDALQAGQPGEAFSYATAIWMRHATGRTEAGEVYALNDPRAAEIAASLKGAGDAAAIVTALTALPGLFPDGLVHNSAWRDGVRRVLARILTDGVRATIAGIVPPDM